MKKLILLFLSAFLFASCALEKNPQISTKADVNFILDKVLLYRNSSFGQGTTLEFDFYMERPDLGIREPESSENVSSEDLPSSLRPKYLFVSETDNKDPMSGITCDKPRSPHRCSISNIDLSKSSSKYLIKITFEDNSYAEKEIEVPTPPIMEVPAIVSPVSSPKQGDTLEMAFKNVGADYYEIVVNLCEPYNNDGINPCLNGVEYTVAHNGDELSFKYENDFTNPKVVSTDNSEIKLTSDFPLLFTEGIEYYVKAVYLSELRNGVSAYTESSDFRYFEIGSET